MIDDFFAVQVCSQVRSVFHPPLPGLFVSFLAARGAAC